MQEFQKRVVTEKSELDEKIEKLTLFICGSIWPTVPVDEQTRMLRQHAIMRDYSSVLAERIAAF